VFEQGRGELLTVRSSVFVQAPAAARFRPSPGSLEAILRCEEHRSLTRAAKAEGQPSLPSVMPTALASPANLRGTPIHGVRIQVCGSSTEPRCTSPNGGDYADTFEISVGPTIVTLSVSAFFYPPSSTVEERLLSLLYSRAKAPKLT
jgi:hypothetical protein